MSAINPSVSVALSGFAANGLAAITTGRSQLDQEAQQLANPDNSESAAATRALLDTQQSLQITQAGANIVSTSDQMMGTLLNIFA